MNQFAGREAPELSPELSVAIVAICSESHLSRCLDSLTIQRAAPSFEIVVAAAGRLGPLTSVASRFPSVRLLATHGKETPIELAGLAVAASRGSVVLLTEDHCAADPEWVATLFESVGDHKKTVGGALDPRPDITGFDWAFYFVDFFRYMLPRKRGPAASVSVCNVGYRSEDLARLGGDWRTAFHETRVHAELMRHTGEHLFEPRARMVTGRRVGYRDGHRERYAFGRMFAAGRLAPENRLRRLLYGAGSVALPALLLIRMGAHAVRSPAAAARFIGALPHVITLVVAWTWGEFLGYTIGGGPRNRDAATER